MKCTVLSEHGHEWAILGLSMSFNTGDMDKLKTVRAPNLSKMDGGHNKFLESISVWLDITAPRFWWAEFDTYRVGMTKQSESTMHTLMKKPITQDMFEYDIPVDLLHKLNSYREDGRFYELKNILPEGFLQRRIVTTNYRTIREIIKQRGTHKLREWAVFIESLYDNLEHKELLP